MKTVLISAYRIKQYFANNKLIFSLYLIGSVLCGIMFIYSYGNGVSYMRHSLSEDLIYRQYTVYLTNGSGTGLSGEMMTFLNSRDVEDALFGLDLFPTNGDMTRITCTYKNQLRRYADKGRVYFTEEEIADSKNVVILPDQDYTRVGDQISLYGENFEVIGKAATYFGEYCIPYSTFQKLHIPPSFIKIIATERQDLHNDPIFTKLQTLYPDAEVEQPYAEQSEKSNAYSEILFVCIVYAICMLTFACLVKYMVELSAAENVICMIVGASKAKLLRLLLIDTFFLSAVSAGLSVLIHYLCRNSIFAYINQYKIQYGASEYFLIFMFMIAISLLMIIPFICVICKNSIIESRHIYEK